MDYRFEYIKNGTINLEDIKHIDYINDMINTPQDPIWHGEGNVYIHTQMVIDSLHEIEEFNELPINEKELLLISALFHDVEKRSTTTTEIIDGVERIVAPSHAKKGESTTRFILYSQNNINHDDREHICKLIRYHTKPIHIKNDYDIIKLSTELNIKLLCILAKADIKGRTCPDKGDLIDNIEYFELMAKELNCYDKEFVFENDIHRFKFLNRKIEHYSYIPFDDTKSKVILMSGIAGSGKDTWIKKSGIKNVISLDDIRRERKIKHGDKKGNGQVIQYAKEKAREFLRKSDTFIWNGTNITKDLRSSLISLFLEYNAYVEIVYIEPAYNVLISQNNKREHSIPKNEQLKMIHKLEPPSKYESHKLTKILH